MRDNEENSDLNSGGGIRGKVSAFLELTDGAKVTFVGNGEFLVENYRGIVRYGSDLMEINAGRLNLRFCGRNMEIKTMTRELLYVTGTVSSLSFENK